MVSVGGGVVMGLGPGGDTGIVWESNPLRAA
jgi:hypothetical protein